jgi:uncharacterized membrane protein YdbT with pleckstrin-like domain
MAEGDTSATPDSVEALRTGKPPRVLAPEQVLAALRASRLFHNLTEIEFREVLTLLRSSSVAEGDLLIEVGGNDSNLYIIRKGRALIRSAEKGGKDPIKGVAEAGELLNELSFTTERPDDVTIEAATPLLLWYIPRADFRALLADHDDLAEHLDYSEEARAIRDQKRRFAEQRVGEKILWFSRRHWWAFLRSQFLTIGLGVLLLLFVLVPGLDAFENSFIGAIIVSVLAIATALVFAWNAYDYWNDYFVITDQRVIHRERVLLIYDQQDESPMGKVQNVTVNRPGFAATLFDVGDVLVETQGARANVAFTTCPKPDTPSKIILGEQSRARRESSASDRSKVRAELRRAMRVGDDPVEGESKKPEKTKPPLRQRLGANLLAARNNILPRLRLSRGAETVWRRHWVYLVQTTFLPALCLVLYIAALVFISLSLPGLGDVLSSWPGIVLTVVIGFGLLFWFVWQYENWRNDLYILTPDRLVDYKRTPFGLLGTTQRTANLSTVQNVTATTKGFIDTLFNMGDVAIRTGGVENELLFARVWNPRMVQSEIVKALEEFQNSQRQAEAAQRRRDFIEWMGIYDELTRIHTARKPLV